jgi:hypothetical protein
MTDDEVMDLWKRAFQIWHDSDARPVGNHNADDVAAAAVLSKALESAVLAAARQTRDAALYNVERLWCPSLPHEAREKILRCIEGIQLDAVTGIWRLGRD